MVNNFDLIEPLLDFPRTGDSFYFLQILQRKKDHPGVMLGGSNNNSRLIKSYHITSKEKLRIHEEEIIKISELFGARASINLNPRSFEKAAYRLLTKVADQMSNKDFYNVRKAYDSICGEYHAEIDKRWLIDIDSTDKSQVDDVINFVTELQKTAVYKEDGVLRAERKILAVIPSKNGYHIISQPFNKLVFNKEYPQHEIHCNNPTNLFIP